MKSEYMLLMPYFILGFIPEDLGDHLNPLDINGNLTLDKKFNVYDPETQLWIKNTCNNFKVAHFADKSFMQSFDCAFDAYADVAKQMCSNALYSSFVPQCCQTTEAPFDNLRVCLPLYQAVIHNRLHLPGIQPYPREILDIAIFHPKTNDVVGYVLPLRTHWYNSYNYDIFAHYYNSMKNYFKQQQKDGPETVQHGFMALRQWVWFWDLQNALYSGTYYSIGMSISVSAVVMLMTSLNVLITCYAMVTIGMAITSTVAAIVLMGWSLSVIESIIISLSVGLSIDFTIHYGMAYRLSRKASPIERVRESFKTVGSAVTMAALTTFTSGAAMMPCRVLPYIKLGIFLMLVMTSAYIYATFFFQSVCRIIGPRKTFCQLRLPKCFSGARKRAGNDASVDARLRLGIVGNDDAPLSL